MSKTPSVVIFPHVQVVNFEAGPSATTTFTGPAFASNAEASDVLRNLQVSPPAAGATVGVAAGLELPAVVAPDDAVVVAVVVAVVAPDDAVVVVEAVVVEPEQATDKKATLTMSRLRDRY
jgi:hypothetical protein